MDWESIKAEYIVGSMGYRKLAKDKGISFNTLKDRAVNEGWYEQRQQYRNATTTKIVKAKQQKTVKKAVDIIDVADKLLEKIGKIAEMYDDPDSLKKLTSAIKDLKDIKGYKSAEDRAEQMARIEKLRKECEKDGEKNLPDIVITGLPEDMKK